MRRRPVDDLAEFTAQRRFFFCDLRRATAAPNIPIVAKSIPPLTGLSPGAAEHEEPGETLTCPCASAEHSPPSQLALALPLTWMLRRFFNWSTQLSTSLALTNWPLQKSAPFGVEHWARHPPVTVASQLASPCAWQSMLHFAFTSAVHDPLHDAWHCASHVADGGVPEHFALQLPLQFALHSASQFVLLPSEAHSLEQSASHVPVQSPSQL
jgi:hypothetical protein